MNSLYFKEQGEGSVLILLHGFCETYQIWEEILPELSTYFKIIAPDLPGFGKSKIVKSDFTIKDVAQVIIKLIDEMHIRKCVLIGHSLGGYVALALTEERPDLVQGLCLFHSTALADSEEKKSNRNKTMDFVRKNGTLPFIETFVPSLFYQNVQTNTERVFKIASKTTKKAILGYSKAMRDRPDMSHLLKVYSNPVLFLAGDHDTIIPINSLSEQVKTSISGKLEVIVETGHMGMLEDPASSIKILKDFAWGCFHPSTP